MTLACRSHPGVQFSVQFRRSVQAFSTVASAVLSRSDNEPMCQLAIFRARKSPIFINRGVFVPIGNFLDPKVANWHSCPAPDHCAGLPGTDRAKRNMRQSGRRSAGLLIFGVRFFQVDDFAAHIVGI